MGGYATLHQSSSRKRGKDYTMNEKSMTRDMVFQTAKAVLAILVALVLVALTVLELLPQGRGGIDVKERIEVSSARIYADGSLYSTELRGILRNSEKEAVTVESVVLVIDDGNVKKNVTLEGFVLPAGAEYSLSHRFEDAYCFENVREVRVRVAGTESRVSNRSVSAFPISGFAIACVVLLIPTVLFAVHTVQGCLYLCEERRATGKKA